MTPSTSNKSQGKVYLIPSSPNSGEIARILREGYDASLLNDGYHDLIEALNLDVLLIDTHPGINEETLLSIAISDSLLVIMRPDHQDYQGTSVTIEIAQKLYIPNLLLLINKVPVVFDFDQITQDVEALFSVAVAGILPHSDEMLVLGSEGIFAVKPPDHPITKKLQALADRLLTI